MGGSFAKQFGKLTAKVVDPFGISKPLRKVIDPLNIMDPLNVLPTSGDKWLTADKNFGGPAQKWLGINQQSSSYYPMTKGVSASPEYFGKQQEMLANMRQQQQAKLANLRSQGELYPTTSAATVKPTQEPQPTTTAPLDQSKSGDTTASADMPTDYIYKPATAKTNAIAANTFQMPDMSSIKFGGA